LIAALWMRDVYQATARLEIDSPNSGIKTLHEIEDSRPTDNQDYLETKSQILQSDSLAVSVIRELHLDRNPEFVTRREVERLGTQKKAGAPNVLTPASPHSFLKEQLYLADRTALEAITLSAFHKRLAVSPIRNSRMLEVSFAAQDPLLAQRITNSLVTQFIEHNYRTQYASTMESSGWLSEQLVELRRKLEESNQAVTDYQKKYNLVEADDRDVPLGQLMGEVNHQLSDAQANRIEAEAFARMIDLGQSEAIPAVRDDQLYQSLMTRYVDIRAQLAQARAIYGDENSNVKKLENESNELATQVEAERARMVNRVRTSFAAASDRERMMLETREKLRAQMGDASSHLVAYRMLKNEAISSAQLYNTLEGRLKEAGIYAGLRSSNIRVIDLAAMPEVPTSPHRALMLIAGGATSCLLALFLAFVRESFNNKVRTPDDIEEWTGLRSLATLPSAGRMLPQENSLADSGLQSGLAAFPEIIAMGNLTPEGEALRQLRTALLSRNAGAGPRTILVSSPSGGEGKSTVALNLAIVLAQRGKTCLLDADIRRPAISGALRVQPSPGLCQVLRHEAALETCLSTIPAIPNLSVLPAGPFSGNPADTLSREDMHLVIGVLQQQFEYVVVDSPPAIPFSDARILSSTVDAVILVGRYGVTTRRAIIRCSNLFDEVGAPVFGVVLNDIDHTSADFRYYTNIANGRAPYKPGSDAGQAQGVSEHPPQKTKSAHA
jgi:capsular exopolysaccharide synthesis family protein